MGITIRGCSMAEKGGVNIGGHGIRRGSTYMGRGGSVHGDLIFYRIIYVLSVRGEGGRWLREWLTISHHIREMCRCFGILKIGNHCVKNATMKRRRARGRSVAR